MTLLELCKCFEKRLWPDAHPLRQFDSVLSHEIISKVRGPLWGNGGMIFILSSPHPLSRGPFTPSPSHALPEPPASSLHPLPHSRACAA